MLKSKIWIQFQLESQAAPLKIILESKNRVRLESQAALLKIILKSKNWVRLESQARLPEITLRLRNLHKKCEYFILITFQRIYLQYTI